jgi:hypothetical protein
MKSRISNYSKDRDRVDSNLQQTQSREITLTINERSCLELSSFRDRENKDREKRTLEKSSLCVILEENII